MGVKCIVKDCDTEIATGLVCGVHMAEIREKQGQEVTAVDHVGNPLPKWQQKAARKITKFIFGWTMNERMPLGLVRRRAYDSFIRLGRSDFVVPTDTLAFRWRGPGQPLEIWDKDGLRETLGVEHGK